MEFLEACRKFIEFDTTPAGGTLEIAKFAAELARSMDLRAEVFAENSSGIVEANVVVRAPGEPAADELLLQTHLDTTEPGAYALWTKTGANPFNASIYNDDSTDLIYGLGAASAKLDFLCKLWAMAEVSKARGRVPAVLAGTFGEETGMIGAIKLIRRKLISSTTALIGEPTDMLPIHAGKGFAAVDIEVPFSREEREFRVLHDLGTGMTTQSRLFAGKAAHSSRPQAGDSAIAKMFEYLERLPDGIAVMNIEGGVSFNTVPSQATLEFDMVGDLKQTINSKISQIVRAIAVVEAEFIKFSDPAFEVPAPTLNIGVIRTYEDFVKISGCARFPPTVSNEDYERWVGYLRDVCESNGAVLRVSEYQRPFRTSLSSSIVKSCQAELGSIGLPTHWGAQSVANEANVFSRFGISCVVIGPGQGVGNSHAPNEHVKVAQLHTATRFYKGVLERVCI